MSGSVFPLKEPVQRAKVVTWWIPGAFGIDFGNGGEKEEIRARQCKHAHVRLHRHGISLIVGRVVELRGIDEDAANHLVAKFRSLVYQ
jgi:hypothetical protein